jgi:vancomycin resistance protein YoaR
MARPRVKKRSDPQSQAVQLLLAILLGSILFMGAVSATLLGFQAYYLGRIYPGVTVSGIGIGGLTPDAAAKKIAAGINYPLQGRIILFDGNQKWQVTPAELGMFLDAETTARSAYQAGRSGTIPQKLERQVNMAFAGIVQPPVYAFDQQLADQLLMELASKVDKPRIEARLSIDGTEITVQQGQVGRKLDVPATLAMITSLFQKTEDGAIPLVVNEDKPRVVDISTQAALARRIISQPLTLTIPAGQEDPAGPWVIEPAELAGMLSFQYTDANGSSGYQVTLKQEALQAYLADLAPSITKNEKNARFIFNDSTKKLDLLENSVTGRSLNIDESIKSIQERALAGDHNIPLIVAVQKPEVTGDATADSLGIHELIHQEVSYFYGSSDARVQNISTAAKNFLGLLVAPGATFSMADNMGDVSLDNGYAEALIIYGGRTIKGVGGGVCQVSTTLFRSVFFSGFPIVERTPHAYRVSYYEQTPNGGINPDLAGLDATVFVPLVDFKFTNNSKNWILMETYVSPSNRTLTWKLYSTSDGRTIDWKTTGPTNIVPVPEPLYRENPDMASGEVKQVDWQAEGAEINVDRTVTRDGKVILQDSVHTKYEPWQAVYEYGPGTEGMPPPPAST